MDREYRFRGRSTMPNGDGRISASDALHVINRLPNSADDFQAPVAESESVEDVTEAATGAATEATRASENEDTASSQKIQSFNSALDSDSLDAVLASRSLQADSADMEDLLTDAIELLSSDQINR